MKLTITLTDAEVKGLRAYLKEVSGESRVTRDVIREEIQNIVTGTLNAPHEAVSDYIRQAEGQP